MTNLMTNAVNFFRLRGLALNLAGKWPVMTALFARILLVVALTGLFLSALGIVAGNVLGNIITLVIAVFSFILSWAMLAAAKEVYCRRQGLPVHPW